MELLNGLKRAIAALNTRPNFKTSDGVPSYTLLAELDGIVKAAEEKAKLIVIRDSDEYVNLITTPPAGMDFEVAKGKVSDAIDKAQEDDPDEWTYEDVDIILTAQGFTVHEFEEVDE